MYANLTLKNAKKSARDYMIYFITIMLCSSLFYAFTSLSSENYEFLIEGPLSLENLKMLLKYSTYLITLVLSILVFYVNSYMVKRRYKEFGTYILLGMEQRTVAFMFFIEALVIGILAVACGILFGTILSQLVTIFILVGAEQEILFNFRFYFDTAIQTFIFFLVMFAIIGFLNILILNKIKLIDFMNQDKKTDCRFKRKGFLYIILFIMGVGCYLFSFKSFMALIDVFAENAAFNAMKALLYGGIAFVVGTYFLFYSASYILVIVKERCKGFKYKGINLVLIGGLSSKIKSSPCVLATITITLLVGMISFIGSLMMSQWSIGYLEYRLPFELMINNEIVEEDGKFTRLNMDYESYEKELNKEIYGMSKLVKFDMHYLEDNIKEAKQFAMKLSDYNELREILNYDEVKLAKNEFIVQAEKTLPDEEIDKYISKNKTIKHSGKTLVFKENGVIKDSIGEAVYDYHTKGRMSLIYIVNDELIEGEEIISQGLVADINDNIPLDKMDILFENLWDIFETSNSDNLKRLEESKERIYPYIRAEITERNSILNAMLGMRVLGMYLGVVLFMISLTILGLKQLVDSVENKERFRVLQKLGVEKEEINKVILKQVSIYFGTALVIGIIGFSLFLAGYLNIYGDAIEVYIGQDAFILNTIASVVTMIALYTGYFVMTYQTFKRNIWR
ncbi:MAG: FtsX-like permease family protein [Sarcina sp.]